LFIGAAVGHLLPKHEWGTLALYVECRPEPDSHVVKPCLGLMDVQRSLLDFVVLGHNMTWSKDGTKLAFSHADKVYVLQTSDYSIRQLSKTSDEYQLIDWSSDGEQLVYVSNQDKYLHSLNMEGDTLALANQPILGIPDVPADGKLIVYDLPRYRNASHSLNVYNVETGAIQNIAEAQNTEAFSNYRFSPDSTRVAYLYTNYMWNTSQQHLVIVEIKGSFRRYSYELPIHIYSFVWSEDGTKFMAYDRHESAFYEIDIRTGQYQKLAQLPKLESPFRGYDFRPHLVLSVKHTLHNVKNALQWACD
jgi:Tol biopolymer transport system component